MDHPKDVRYTQDHEWARKDQQSVVVGITGFAVSQLGDITLVELPQIGTQLKKGEPLGTIESVKSVSEIYAPVSGEITKINEALEDQPELVNDSPFTDGWMVEISAAQDTEYDALLDADAYTKLTAEQDH